MTMSRQKSIFAEGDAMDVSRNDHLPIVLVDDETQVLLLYSGLLKRAGLESVVTLDDSCRVLPFLRENQVLAVLADMNRPSLLC